MCCLSSPVENPQNICHLFLRLSLPASPVPGISLPWEEAAEELLNRRAAARTGRNMLGEGPNNAAQLFLLYHQAVKLKNDLKSKGCAGSTGASCLWALGAFCVNWTFFFPFFLDGLISWKGRASTHLECRASSLIPLAQNCTRVSWGQRLLPVFSLL